MKTTGPQNIWLIGCSSGIGYELAALLLKEQHRLILSARNLEPLEALTVSSAGRAQAIACDVTQQSSVDRCVNAIKSQWSSLDCVIYCAGTCHYVEDGNLQASTIKKVFDSNFFGLVYVLERTIPLLKQSKSAPYVVALSSLSTLVPFPRAEAYGASKAAMKYLLDSLRIDLESFNIDVSCVSPGFVATPMTATNDFPMPWIIDADKAAQEILAGMKKRKKDINFPKKLSYLLHLANILRPVWINYLAPRLQRSNTGNL